MKAKHLCIDFEIVGSINSVVVYESPCDRIIEFPPLVLITDGFLADKSWHLKIPSQDWDIIKKKGVEVRKKLPDP